MREQPFVDEEVETSSNAKRDGIHARKKHRPETGDLERADSTPQVIARIPRLNRDHDTVHSRKSRRSEQRRLLGTRLSTWTILGGVGFLIVAAVLTSLVSNTFQSSNGGSREASQRPDVPSPDAPPAPRWAATSSGSEKSGVASSPKTGEPPSFVSPSGSFPVATPSQGRGNEAPFTSVIPPGAAAPWQPVPGARSPEVLPGGALGSLPTTSPVLPQSAPARPNYDDERFPARGGLVNAMPPSPREMRPIDPRPDYRFAPPPDPRPDYRSVGANVGAMDVRPEDRPSMTPGPRPDYRDAPFDARPDYRTAARPRYSDGITPGSNDRRNTAAEYPRYSDYGGNPAFASPNVGVSGREQPAGYESPAAPAARNPMSGRPGNSASTGPEWVSPPNWVTPPAWESPIGTTPSQPPQAPFSGPGRMSPSQPPQAPVSTPASYPATGYSGPENWGIGNPPVSTWSASPADDFGRARFEGNIERPTNRMSYEHTRPSIR